MRSGRTGSMALIAKATIKAEDPRPILRTPKRIQGLSDLVLADKRIPALGAIFVRRKATGPASAGNANKINAIIVAVRDIWQGTARKRLAPGRERIRLRDIKR